MTDETGRRLAVLTGLFVLGLVIAAGGTALGAGNTLVDDRPETEFSVSDDGVRLTDGDQQITVAEDMSGVQTVDISAKDGEYRVDIEEVNGKLTPPQRDRAERIARANETVATYLDGVDGANLSVEPIQRIEATEHMEGQLTNDNETTLEDGTAKFTVTGGNGSSVHVDRDPEYVDDEVVVRVSTPDGRQRYAVTVNLQTEDIVGFTDWEQVRE